jgi:hypothetical protein
MKHPLRETTIYQGCAPCPRGNDAGCDQTRLHASGCTAKLFRVLRREAGVASLYGRQDQHEPAEEQPDAYVL